MTPTHVVFDIGNVLVDWDPCLIWQDELGSRAAVEAFIDRIGFSALNLRCDGGERFTDVAEELSDPEDRRLMRLYVPRFHLGIADPIPGTWEIVDQLEARKTPIHAITNWSAETWPAGMTSHPRLGTMFGTTIVSGEVKLLKPDLRIYETFLGQAGLEPSDCVFVDDKLENVEGAKAAGMDGIHFTGADALADGLKDRGLL